MVHATSPHQRANFDLCTVDDVDLRPRPPALLEAMLSRASLTAWGLRRVKRVFLGLASSRRRLSKCLMQRCRIQRGYAIAGSSQDTAIARLALVVYCRYSPESAKCPRTSWNSRRYYFAILADDVFASPPRAVGSRVRASGDIPYPCRLLSAMGLHP